MSKPTGLCSTCTGCGRLYNKKFKGTDKCDNYFYDGTGGNKNESNDISTNEWKK